METCNCINIDKEKTDSIKSSFLTDDLFHNLSDFFKVFGDPTRLKILFALTKSELCVCDISSLLNLNQSTVSHQLKQLKQARLVKFRRAGKVIYYSLNDSHIEKIFEQGLEHVNE